MTIDWTLNVGSLLALFGFLFTVAVFYVRNESMREDVVDIKRDIKSLNQIVTEVAIQKQRLDGTDVRLNELSRRINAVEEKFDKRFDELRRGEGPIVHQPALAEQRR